MDAIEYTAMAGERIQEWVDKEMTFENECKRMPDEDDLFEAGEVSWVFTQKGQRLYESYVSKVKLLISHKFPCDLHDDIEQYTGVVYP